MTNETVEEIKKLVLFKAKEAQRFLPEEELEDLVQIGFEVAIKAHQRYDAQRQVQFTTFLFPYLSRYFLGLYAKSQCNKKGLKRQKVVDAKQMEEHPPIFPDKYRVGTIYCLDRFLFDDDDCHPFLADELFLSRTPYDELESKDMINALFKQLDETSKKVLKALLFPTDDAAVQKKKKADYFCTTLHITNYQYSHSLSKIKNLLHNIKTI